jgi:hypothetical protein
MKTYGRVGAWHVMEVSDQFHADVALPQEKEPTVPIG